MCLFSLKYFKSYDSFNRSNWKQISVFYGLRQSERRQNCKKKFKLRRWRNLGILKSLQWIKAFAESIYFTIASGAQMWGMEFSELQPRETTEMDSTKATPHKPISSLVKFFRVNEIPLSTVKAAELVTVERRRRYETFRCTTPGKFVPRRCQTHSEGQ